MTPDPITVDRAKLLHPDFRAKLMRTYQSFYDLHQKRLRIAQGFRSPEDQEKIWEQGRHLVNGVWQFVDPVHHQGVVSYAPPGSSWHEYGLAADSCFLDTPHPFLEDMPPKESEFLWSELARLGKAHGLEAGFDWPHPKQDKPHLQLRYGLTLSDVKSLQAHGRKDAVWYRVDQILGHTPGSGWKTPSL